MTQLKTFLTEKLGERRFSFLLYPFALILFLSACTLGQFSPEQLQATIDELAATSMVLTLTALPTSTPLPSATPTLAPTATVEPAALPADTSTPLPTDQPTLQATWTPYGLAQPTDFEDSKTDKDDKNAPLLLDNESGEEIHFIILSPVYADYTFSGNMSLILPEGTYHYRAWIGDKGPINGSFSITNGDKHILIFYKDKIHFSTP